MRARVTIRFKPGVLDPQAAAIAGSLKGLGFETVQAVTQAKLIELELAVADAEEAHGQARAMCEAILANPVIETYEITIEG